MPASMQSMARTRPQRVVYRRDKFFPDHPHFAQDLHTDPELFNLDRPVEKRMPFVNEKWFDAWRDKGFFAGDPKVTRTHYIEFERAWRSRIRGLEHSLWNREKKEWERRDKSVFLIQRSIELGYPLTRVKAAQPLTARELFDARPESMTINDSELHREVLKTIKGLDIAGREIIFERGTWLSVKKPARSEGSPAALEEAPEDVEEIAQQDALNKRVNELVRWSAVEKRLDTPEEAELIDRRPWKESLVGYRVYLPNIVVRLVRNHTPKDQPYDPYIATFRIPTGMTKTDLRSYLKSVYDLDITFIRTDLYWGKVIRDQKGRKIRQKGMLHNYKRAVVGLYEPFHYPDDLDELRALGRATGRGDEYAATRMATMESTFFAKTNAMMRKRFIQKILKRASYRYRDKGSNNKVSRSDRNLIVSGRVLTVGVDCAQHPHAQAGAGEHDPGCGRGAASPGQQQHAMSSISGDIAYASCITWRSWRRVQFRKRYIGEIHMEI